MSRHFPGRANCPVCERWITLKADGTFRPHGPQTAPCIAVNNTPDQAARLVLPPLSEYQEMMLRDCWRVGDWRPIELEFGVTCPHYNLYGDEDEALADMIGDVRRWIEKLVELSRKHSDRCVS